jgi:Xaa-Pro aminopeptidase
MIAGPPRDEIAWPDSWRLLDLGVPVEELRAERLRRATTLMAEQGVRSLVVLSGGSFGERALVRFLANHATTGRQTAAVLQDDGRLILLVAYSAHFAWAMQSSWADEVRLVTDLEESICSLIETAAPTDSVGVAGPPLAVGSLAVTARRLLPNRRISLVSSGLLALQVRKSAFDVQLARRSGALASQALATVESRLLAGMTDRDVYADLECEVRRGGAETSSILVSSDGSVASGFPRPRAIREGDLVQMSVEVAAAGGYWVQAVRTVPVALPPGRRADALAAARSAERELVSQMRAGCEIRSLSLPEGALPVDLAPAVPFWHGIGLSLGEPPSQDSTASEILEAGMVIAVHPNLYGGDIGIFVGNTYLVEGDGAASLTGGSGPAQEIP